MASELLPHMLGMTLKNATRLIKAHAEAMNARYGRIVFDEWAIVSFVGSRGFLHAYSGPRENRFQNSFLRDAESLWADLLTHDHDPGDFEFSHDGLGTRFESFTVLGEGVYLIWNNTVQCMDDIAKNPLWLGAQVPFLDLGDKFRADPMLRPPRLELSRVV